MGDVTLESKQYAFLIMLTELKSDCVIITMEITLGIKSQISRIQCQTFNKIWLMFDVAKQSIQNR